MRSPKVAPSAGSPSRRVILDAVEHSRVTERVSASSYFAQKYWLLVRSLPIIAACIIVRVVLDNVINFQGFWAMPDVAVILTGGFFLIGFMLSGVMADYKESEKLPAEITAILETFEETGTTFALMKDRDADVSGYRRKVLTCLNAILKWLSAGDKSDPRYSVEVWAAINKLTSVVTAVYDLAGPPNAARLLNSLTDLRRFLLRLGVISSTTYLPHGYVLVELFVLMALVLVTLGRYASSAACYSVLVFVSLIFVYVYLLLTDADDPFEYHEIKEDETATGQTGSAEIDLSPLLDYRVRLRSRLAADDAHAAALAAAVAAAAAASNQPLFIITEQP